MKSPNGFGKNYFTFASVLAFNVQTKLNAQTSRNTSYFSKLDTSVDKDEEVEEPTPELSIKANIVNSKPCHCDCFFRLKTKIALLINIFIPRCPYYTTYFAFRRTGVHPPL